MEDRQIHEDDRLDNWIREAGEPMVEPDTGHIESVRQILLDRAKVAKRRAGWSRRVSVLAVVGIAAALLIGLFPWGSGSSTGWAQVVAAVRAKPWIHSVTELPDGEKAEFWRSPSGQVAASRCGETVTHYDLRLKTLQTYDPANGNIIRTAMSESFSEEIRSFDAVLRGIFHGDDEIGSPMPRAEVVNQRRSTVRREGREWIHYELSLRQELDGRPGRVVSAKVLFRVDPDTQLPRSMLLIADNGREPQQEVKHEFDYPDEGPSDIYALGVPRSAVLDDRVPTGDLAQIIAANEAGREGLASYCAVVVNSIGEPDDLFQLVPHRLWKKGERWRLEMGWPTPDARKAVEAIRAAEELPAEVDTTAWWNGHLAHFRIWAKEVCDGNTVYRSTSSDPKKGKWEASERASAKARLKGLAQPYAVECHAYPSLPAGYQNIETELDLHPEDGPAGTVSLTFLLTGNVPNACQIQRYWLDPTRGYVTCRHEATWRYREPPTDNSEDQLVASKTIHVMEDFKQSPQGVWYPTKVRRAKLLGEEAQGAGGVYRYWLDFEVEIPDSLFKPKG